MLGVILSHRGNGIMDHSEQILGQLRVIKWLTGLIVCCFVTIAVTLVWLAVEISGALPGLEGQTDFSEQMSALLEQGQAKEVLDQTAAREKTHPLDPCVFWYRGLAHHQLGHYEESLKAVQRVHQIAPSWRASHTTPFMQGLHEDLAAKKAKAGDML